MSRKSKAQWAVSTFFENNQESILDKKSTNTVRQKTAGVIVDPTAEYYDPLYRHDLALSRQKLQALDAWFNDLEKTCKVPKMLLLTGPNGSCKTTAVQILAKERSMTVIEYNPPDFLSGTDAYTSNFDAVKLKSFLLRVGRYNQVDENMSEKKLIILEHLPETITSEKSQLIEVLRCYLSVGKIPLVLICSENSPNTTLDANARSALSMDHIVFKTVTEASIKKALLRIIKLRGYGSGEFKDMASSVAQTSGGNIRKAISQLKFYLVYSDNIPVTRTCSKSEQRRKIEDNTVKQDTGIFHAVGRVLYAKRKGTEDPDNYVVIHGKELYGELEHKPLDIAEKYSDCQRFFLKLLHSNYPKTFSSVEDIANAAEYLSQGELFMAEWMEKQLSQEIGFLVAVGGVMNSCFDPVKQWTPLTTDVKSGENIVKPEVFWEIRKAQPSLFGISDNAIALEIVPNIDPVFKHYQIKNPKCEYGLYTHDYSQFILQLKTLTEKENAKVSQALSNAQNCSNNEDSFSDLEMQIIDDED